MTALVWKILSQGAVPDRTLVVTDRSVYVGFAYNYTGQRQGQRPATASIFLGNTTKPSGHTVYRVALACLRSLIENPQYDPEPTAKVSARAYGVSEHDTDRSTF